MGITATFPDDLKDIEASGGKPVRIVISTEEIIAIVDLAKQYATNSEDAVVEGDNYSALHWAKKAQKVLETTEAIVSQAVTDITDKYNFVSGVSDELAALSDDFKEAVDRADAQVSTVEQLLQDSIDTRDSVLLAKSEVQDIEAQVQAILESAQIISETVNNDKLVVESKAEEVTTLHSEVSSNAAAATNAATSANESAESAINSANLASTSKDAALVSAEEANDSKVQAKSSSDSARDSAQEASDSALTAKEKATAAISSVQSANNSASVAHTSATTASTAMEDALAYSNDARESADAALSHKNSAGTSETNAMASKDDAELAASQATQSKDEAAQSASRASTSESNAHLYELEAKAARDEAQSATGALTGGMFFGGEWDASEGTPVAPVEGSVFYKVTGSGTINGVDYGTGDNLIYDNTNEVWFKIDNTESVTSVNGKQGVVSLNKSDVGLDNIDNTRDVDKPVSTAVASALAGKLDDTYTPSWGDLTDVPAYASRWPTSEEIDALPSTGKATDSDKLNGLVSSQFLRKDISQMFSGDLNVTGELRTSNKSIAPTFESISGTKSFTVNDGTERGFLEGGIYGVRLRANDATGIGTPSTLTLTPEGELTFNGHSVLHEGITKRLEDLGVGSARLPKNIYGNDLNNLFTGSDVNKYNGSIIEVAVDTANRPTINGAHASLAGTGHVTWPFVTIKTLYPQSEPERIYQGYWNGASFEWIELYTSGNLNPSNFAQSSHTHDISQISGVIPYIKIRSSEFMRADHLGGSSGAFSTNHHIISGKGSGGVALSINDGAGNANVTFNNLNAIPEQDGNSARIVVNTDDTSNASFKFLMASGVTKDVQNSLTEVMYLSETEFRYGAHNVWHKGNFDADSAMRSTYRESVMGIAQANGLDNGWVRTPGSGLLPYESGKKSALGSLSWQFHSSHIDYGYFYNGIKLDSDRDDKITLRNVGDSWNYLLFTRNDNTRAWEVGIKGDSSNREFIFRGKDENQHNGRDLLVLDYTDNQIRTPNLRSNELRVTGVAGNSIAGTDFDKGWFKIGSASAGISMDSNEIYFVNNGMLGTFNGDLNLRPADNITMLAGKRFKYGEGSFENGEVGQFTINTQYGNASIGPRNSEYCHFYTDRGQFYFNEGVQSKNLFKIYNSESALRRTGSCVEVGDVADIGSSSRQATQTGLEVIQAANADSMISFHINDRYALKLGLCNESNRLAVGGGSDGAVKRDVLTRKGFYFNGLKDTRTLNYAETGNDAFIQLWWVHDGGRLTINDSTYRVGDKIEIVNNNPNGTLSIRSNGSVIHLPDGSNVKSNEDVTLSVIGTVRLYKMSNDWMLSRG